MEPKIEDVVSDLRKATSEIAEKVVFLKKHSAFDGKVPDCADLGEMAANVMLAYRHLEDARMRLGKVLQAHDGGKSVCDR